MMTTMIKFPVANLFSKPWAITRSGWETARYNLMERNGDEVQPRRALFDHGCDYIGAATRGTDIWGNPIDGMFIAGGTAFIPVAGVIAANIGPWEKTFGFVDVNDLDNELELATGDPRVNDIEFIFDSPGGYVTGVPEFADKIAAVNDSEKKVTAAVGGMCCSAAYWMAVGTYSIRASKTSDVGSIGVYQPIIDYSRLYKNAGVDVELAKSGKFKGQEYPGTPVSEEYKAHVQSEIDTIFGWFAGHVTKYRPSVSADTMQGQSFLAEEAFRRGLVDIVN